jgi:hypothetical protein
MDIGSIATAAVGDYVAVLGIATLDGSGSVVVLPWNEGNITDYAGQ